LNKLKNKFRQIYPGMDSNRGKTLKHRQKS